MKYSTLIISLIILLLLIAAGIFAWQQMNPAPTDDGPTPTIIQTPTNDGNGVEPDGNTEVPEEWKTYRNEELGFEVSYPGEWFLYDDKKIEEDEHNSEPCIGLYNRSMVAFSKEDLGRCVGPSGDTLLRGDLSIHPFEGKISMDSPEKLPEGGSRIEKIQVANVAAWKAFFTEDSVRPRDFTVNVYVNHPTEEKNYLITFPQKDQEGKYDSLYDQILSTFRFID